MPRKYTRKDGAKPRVAIPPDILKAAVDKTIPLIKARLLNHKICVFYFNTYESSQFHERGVMSP